MEIGFFCELGCVSFLKKYSGSIRKQCHDPNYSNKVLSFFLRVFIETNELILLYILQTVCHSQGSRLGKHRCRFKNCGWCGMQMGDCSSLPLDAEPVLWQNSQWTSLPPKGKLHEPVVRERQPKSYWCIFFPVSEVHLLYAPKQVFQLLFSHDEM